MKAKNSAQLEENLKESQFDEMSASTSSEEQEEEEEEEEEVAVQHPKTKLASQDKYFKQQTQVQQSEESSEENSYESEDEMGSFSTKNQTQVLETLLRLKRKDPSIYNTDTKFYSSEEEVVQEGEDIQKGMGKEEQEDTNARPMLLTDFHAEMISHGGEAALEQAEKDFERQKPKTSNLLYNEQQRENLRDFQQQLEQQISDSDSDVDLMDVLEKQPEQFNQQQKISEQKQEDREDQESKREKLLNEVFDEEDEKERFLRDYLLKERWKRGYDDEDEDEGQNEAGGTMQWRGNKGQINEVDTDEDQEQMIRADEFENKYNFRYEEEGGDKIQSFPRQLEGTFRERKSRKKQQRESKAKREAEKKEEQEREVKRQKNVKTSEIKEIIKKVQEEAGGHVDSDKLMKALLSGGDLSEFYEHLDAAFGEEYYAGQDENEKDNNFKKENTNSDSGDVILNGSDGEANEEDDDIDDQEENSEIYTEADKNEDDAYTDEEMGQPTPTSTTTLDENDVGDVDGGSSKGCQVKRLKEFKNLLSQKAEEYHNLDYEEEVDGIKWRFNYTSVPKDNFGLTPEEMLTLNDVLLI
eukprot:TRINITY_DN2296_c0_g1_i1.p1 TRINITY_DN2296_c0_g1~~TRINITY_DN2296_c0_g1_i1.p1  ORF type:complete len:582 (-),score=166.78 TRINITY_DN2296_c0_g1_i1:11-1756(-)